MNEHDRLCLLGLSLVEFLRPREKLALCEMLGSPSKLFELSLPDIAWLIRRKLTTGQWRPHDLLRKAASIQNDLTGWDARSIFYWDSSYPPQLREIFDPPVTLFLRGTLPDSGMALAGVVGTRFPTGAARAAAFRLGFDLGREGIGVVSGLARGIDREAHEGCVEAGGRSVAVLGNGIDRAYPDSSSGTAVAILSRGGCLLSEYPPGIPPTQYHFPARNRIISGLCRAVIVVQAPERSGALITAEYALEQGRDLWVHAEGISGGTGAGTRRLEELGAPVMTRAMDLLRDWGREPRATWVVMPPVDAAAGEAIAARVENEINGAAFVRAGEVYWR